ncbi:MAG: hypothetical protein PHY92_03530 [Alphaproteobacteria bacterium]|nr:hypothetical protein [Alphaproteobacteria bacterium]
MEKSKSKGGKGLKKKAEFATLTRFFRAIGKRIRVKFFLSYCPALSQPEPNIDSSVIFGHEGRAFFLTEAKPMRARLVLAALVFMSLSFPALAGGKMLGLPCTDLGSTTMGDDRTTLVACMLLYSDPSATGANCTLAATVGNSCVWKAMSSGGVASITYYCNLSSDGYLPTPSNICTDHGGAQGYCPSGFKQIYALGSWGFCYSLGSGPGYFRPPGGGCFGAYGLENNGEAYLCSQ